MKKCIGCLTEKPLSDFYLKKGSPMSYCKICANLKSAYYRNKRMSDPEYRRNFLLKISEKDRLKTKNNFPPTPENGWATVDGFESLYQVSECGKVKRWCREKNHFRDKKTQINKDGYVTLSLSVGYIRKHTSVHRLVAQAFIPNDYGLKEVNHKDGNKLNNHVDNLEWCTRSYNVKHSFDTGLRGKNKLTPEMLIAEGVVKIKEV